MSDGKNKDQKEKLEGQTTFEETANKEIREKVVAREKKEEQVQQESVQKRTGSRLEMMGMTLYSPDKQTASEVEAIDTNSESDEEIQSSLELLGTISISILAKMFEGGIDKNSVDSLAEFKQVLNKINKESKYKKLREKISNVSERSTFRKLQEILNKPNSKIYKELEKHWNEYIKKSKNVINDAKKGSLADVWKKVRDNPGKVVFAVAGAFALHGLYKAFMDEEKSSTSGEKEWHKKIFNKSTGMALGLMALGAILDSDKIMAFAKEYLTGDAKENAIRAAENAKQAAVDALNKDINFDEKKNHLAKLLGKDSTVLEGVSLATILADLDIQPEKTAHTEPFKGAGGAAKLMKKWLKKKGKLSPTIEKILDKFIGEDKEPIPPFSESTKKESEKISPSEVIKEEVAEKQLRYDIISKSLIGLYCLQSKEMKELKDEITAAFEFLHDVKIGTVVNAYESAANKKTVSFESLGIDENPDTNPEALYHACAIITKTFNQAEGLFKSKIGKEQSLEELFNTIGNDPAIELAHGVQNSIENRLKALKITSFADLQASVEKIFEDDTINQLFEQNKEKFLEHVSNKYNLEINDLDKKEKADFLFIVWSLYANSYSLDQSSETVEKIASNRSANEKVIQLTKKLTEAIKNDVLGSNGLLQKSIDRYDIKRPNNEKYDQILQKNLKPDVLYFKDGFQMALLADGIQFDKPAEKESIGQAKDVTMIYLMLRILKDRKPKAYPLYAANIAYIAGSKDLDLNINLQAIAPYFEKLFGQALKASLSHLEDADNFMMGLENLNSDPEKIKKIAERDIDVFLLNTIETGVAGGYEIPRDLTMVLAGKFPEAFDQETDAEQIMRMIITLGGNITYPAVLSQGAGLVYLGGKYFFIRPIGAGWDSLKALATEGPGTAAKTYVIGTAPFVTIGAVGGLLKSTARHGRVLSMALGGLKGLGAPVTYPMAGIRHIVGASETAKNLSRGSKYVWNVAKGRQASNLDMATELYLHYNKLTPDYKAVNIFEKGKQLLKSPLQETRRRLYFDIYNKGRLRWGELFIKNYNEFWGIDPLNPSSSKGVTLKPLRNIDLDLAGRNELLTKVERMQEVIERMKKIEKLDSMSEAKFWKEMETILEGPELRALQAKAGSNFEKFQKSLSASLQESSKNASKVSKLRGYLGDKWKQASVTERFKKWNEGRETSKSTDLPEKKTNLETPEKAPTKAVSETSEVLHDAKRNLETIRKEIRAAESEIKALNDARKSPQFEGWDEAFEKRLTKARQIIADGRAAEVKMQESIKAFENVQEIEGKLAKAITHAPGEVSALNKELKAAKTLAEESLQESAELTKNIGKAGKLGRALKYGGTALGGFGAVISFYQAGSAGYEALTTDVEGRGTVKGVEAGLWTLNAAADTAAVAVLLGAEGAAATGLSAIALPLIPITYVGTNAIEAAYEETVTDYEWAQKNPFEALHHFYTSLNTISVGDVYLAAARLDTKEGLDEHHNTMHKIYRGLVAMQKDPSLLNYILSTPASDTKNKEVERRIEENYSVYHEMYFQSLNPYGIQSYQSAQKTVLDAQIFDRIMTTRDKAKEAGQQFILGNEESSYHLNLCDEEFEMVGGMMAPEFKESKFRPQTIVDKYKEDLTHLLKKDEILWNNLERMDTAYILRLCAQMQIAVNDENLKMEDELKSIMSIQFMTLKNYLEAGRGVNFEFGIRNSSLFEPRMSIDEILETIEALGSGTMEAYLNFEKQNYNPTPSTHALFRLAEFLGYTGEPTEIGLKEFFSEGSASFRGIYWDGENWYIQERGHEFDDKIGPELNEAMIKKIIETMRANPDDILEHRNDAIFLDAHDYTKEVNRMAQILEDGLAEGKQRGYKEAQENGVSTPPTGFKEKSVNYEKKEKDLATEYKEAVEHVKESCNWSRLKYRVLDDNTIELSRTDSNTRVKLTRSGKEWNVGGFKGGLTLAQAVVLGNLKNKVEKIIVENNHSGGSDAPFENDGGNVDFDRNWNPNDLRILDKSTGWLGFYDEVGVNVDDVVETLNNWYKSR